MELLSDPIKTVLQEKVDQEVDFEKTWQFMRLRKCDLYYRGLQFLNPSFNSGFLDWSPTGAPNPGSDSQESGGLFDYNIDLVQNFGLKYQAALGMRPFYNVTAMPDDPQSEIDRKASAQANLIAGWCRHRWQIRIRNIELFYLQWVGGTVYPYTPYVSDKDLFGEIDEPQFTQRQVEIEPAGFKCQNCGAKSPQPTPEQMCPQCGSPLSENNFEEAQTATVPEFVGKKKYPGSGPALHFCTGYTVTVPFNCKDIRKAPYLLYEYEENQGVLLQMFGDALRGKMNDGGDVGGSDAGVVHQQGKLTRRSAQSLTGMYRQGSESTWTFSRYWLATSMYEYIKDKAKRDVLYEQYPDGLKVSRVEGNVVKLENEALADVWGAIPPAPGQTVYQDPVCYRFLGHQDIANDLINIAVAREERGLPSSIVEAGLIDTERLSQRPYLPNELIEAKAEYGGSLREAIVNLPTPNKDEGSGGRIMQAVQENLQQGSGMLPAVFGGGERQATAEATRTQLNQALMQLGIPGEMASLGYADIHLRACKQIAKYAPKGFRVQVPDDNQGMSSEMLDIEALREGNYHFESEPGIPMSFSEKRDQLNQIITQNPDLAQSMGLHDLTVAPAVRDYLLPNMPEIRGLNENVRDKVRERIQLLLEGEPIPSPDGQSPAMPSIQPEDYVDDPAQHAELVREWLNDKPGRKASADPAKEKGYQNVVAYGLQCSQKAVPPPPPAPPPEEPKVSVSLKGEDLIALGVAPNVAQEFGAPAPNVQGQPPQAIPPGPPAQTPPSGSAVPPSSGPPMPGGNGPQAVGFNAAGPQVIQPHDPTIQ